MGCDDGMRIHIEFCGDLDEQGLVIDHVIENGFEELRGRAGLTDPVRAQAGQIEEASETLLVGDDARKHGDGGFAGLVW